LYAQINSSPQLWQSKAVAVTYKYHTFATHAFLMANFAAKSFLPSERNDPAHYPIGVAKGSKKGHTPKFI